jgi:hypothetical protein
MDTDRGEIAYDNLSVDTGITEMIRDSISAVALLLNNPYEEIRIKSLDYNITIEPKNSQSIIWSVTLLDSQVEQGGPLQVEVVVETWLAEKRKFTFLMDIPSDLPPGQYDLLVCGGYDFEEFVRRAAPQALTPVDMPTLIESINRVLHVDKDGLYCVLVLPASGIAVERAELPDLPATKAMILSDAKRALAVRPYQRWIEKSVPTGTIITDKRSMQVIVKEQKNAID